MKMRQAVGGLTISVAAFLGILVEEGFTDKAIIPTKGDVPTLGFGTTVYEDGTRVKMGDTITPIRAVLAARSHIDKDEQAFRASIPGVKLFQHEYDAYLNFIYQFGIGNWNKSSMRKRLIAGDYEGACNALLLYKYSGGYDCSTPGNRICAGVWTRQLKRHSNCMGV